MIYFPSLAATVFLLILPHSYKMCSADSAFTLHKHLPQFTHMRAFLEGKRCQWCLIMYQPEQNCSLGNTTLLMLVGYLTATG